MLFTEKIHKKRFQARYFKKDDIPKKELINSLLKKAFDLVPSKQSLVPYTVAVFGPEQTRIKKKLWDAAGWHWQKDTKQGRQHMGTVPLIAPYLILFCDRRVDDYSPAIKRMVDKGYPYSILNLGGDTHTKCIEVGMFASILTGLCLEKNLAVSYTLCFPRTESLSQFIKDEEILGIDRVFLYMSIGYADGGDFILEKDEYKPPFQNIIDWR